MAKTKSRRFLPINRRKSLRCSATSFVQNGIVILLIKIIGGWAIGIMQVGMKWDEALRTYTLLIIGDGIVTQVPALVIELGAGILVTRSSSDENLSTEVYLQLMLFPETLGIVIVTSSIMLLLPGLPGLPVVPVVPLVALILLFTLAWWFARRARADAPVADAGANESEKEANLYDMLAVDAIEVRVGHALLPMRGDDNAGLMERIGGFRKHYALEAGLVLPRVRVHDDRKLPAGTYDVQIYGNRVAEAELVPDRILALRSGAGTHALPGIETRDPSYGLPAVWVLETQRNEARQAGYTLVDPATVFLTHLGEVLRKHAALLLSRSEVERLIGTVHKSNAGLVEELVPTVLALSEVQKVLQNLLQEKVSIRNLALFLEVLADGTRQSRDAGQLTELVRQRLGATICQSLLGKGNELAVLTLDPTIAYSIATSLRNVDEKTTLVLEPRYAEQLLARMAAQVEKMVKSNLMPVLVCAPQLRRHLRILTERVLPQLSIVSMAEVPSHLALRAFGRVTLSTTPA